MRLTSNAKASSRRSKREWTFAQINFVAGMRGAVVEDDFYNKLERLGVQAAKKDKILIRDDVKLAQLVRARDC